MYEKILKELLIALVNQGVIKFRAYIFMEETVTVSVKSAIFNHSEFSMDIPRDDWDDGPTRAFAEAVMELLSNGEVKILEYDEHGNEMTPDYNMYLSAYAKKEGANE